MIGHHLDRAPGKCTLAHMRLAKTQTSLRIPVVKPVSGFHPDNLVDCLQILYSE